MITGGGGGSMAAANQGAAEAGGRSVGLNIELPSEQTLNPYCDLGIEFHHFFVRTILFVRYASAFVVLPGGVGTLDELFEALTLIQTGGSADFPVILCERDYWEGLLAWLRDGPLARGNIARDDLALLTLVDDPAQVAASSSAAAAAQGARRPRRGADPRATRSVVGDVAAVGLDRQARGDPRQDAAAQRVGVVARGAECLRGHRRARADAAVEDDRELAVDLAALAARRSSTMCSLPAM